MPTTPQDIISIINQDIVTNNNNEITAIVLNPILIAMVQQYIDYIGDLNALTTVDKSNLVNAINEVVSGFTGINSVIGGVNISVDNTDPLNPIINLGTIGSNGVINESTVSGVTVSEALEFLATNQVTVNFLNDVGNVVITNVQTNEIISWNGTNWINRDNAHSLLNLDDGTNPHGTTIADVDPNAANIAYTDVINLFTEDQIIKENKKIQFRTGLWKTFLQQNADTFEIGSDNILNADKAIIKIKQANKIELLYELIVKNINPKNNNTSSLGGITKKFKELFLSSYANVLGIKSAENDPTKVFSSDGGVVDLPKPTETTNTGSSIDLTNSAGNYKTDQTNNATSYTVPTEVMGGWEQRLINAATEPTVSGALKIKGSDFVANTNMYMVTWNNGNINEYHFQEI